MTYKLKVSYDFVVGLGSIRGHLIHDEVVVEIIDVSCLVELGIQVVKFDAIDVYVNEAVLVIVGGSESQKALVV